MMAAERGESEGLIEARSVKLATSALRRDRRRHQQEYIR